MSAWIASGRIVDLILALTLLEAVGLTLWHRRSGGGVAPSEFLVNLLSGALLLLAMRGYVHAAGWQIIALCLALSGAVHATDLARRWRSPRTPGRPE